MANPNDIQWVRERIDPDDWSVFQKLGYPGTAREAVDAAATAVLDGHADYELPDVLADLLEILDAQFKWNAESNDGHARSGPRYQERIKALRQQTEEGPGGGAGEFTQVPVTYHSVLTWDEYAREL